MNRVILTVRKDRHVNCRETDSRELLGYTFESENEDAIVVGDGHHTMPDLYEHRHALFAALCKIYDNYITPLSNGARIKCWKSRFHSDGTMFDGWFIAGITMREHSFDAEGSTKETQITYHMPLEWWDKFKIMEIPNAPIWDGHTSFDVIERLLKL